MVQRRRNLRRGPRVSLGLLQQFRHSADAARRNRSGLEAIEDMGLVLPGDSDSRQAYAAIQERFIAPDGSFPAIGRSLAYRCGAFHLLATMALRRQLPEGMKPEQARAALTAVIRRTIDARGTFDERGWLAVGLCGHQPSIGEPYISTGSLYLCSTALLPLGLPITDPFWSDLPQPWTSQKIWNGQDIPTDHAI